MSCNIDLAEDRGAGLHRSFGCSALQLFVDESAIDDTISHRIHGAAIYGNICHQYTPNVSIYTSTMDPMGMRAHMRTTSKIWWNLVDVSGPGYLLSCGMGLLTPCEFGVRSRGQPRGRLRCT